ncbi:AAA family ATPase [Herminiimonas sp. KBW02]|uniref:AAA family ATPase n=1 Tax=Herminiimonas sp. KBW02 TaxID=2153363 RepID=UPI000F59CEF5|nr:AAA family ATPase [Herminiimonas sp. KBW02]RQO33462.1 AAA family ATPase [Herminiimonas sp. KBW02]
MPSSPSLQDTCLTLVEIWYLRDGNEFNGLPLQTLCTTLEKNWIDLRSAVIALVKQNDVNLLWENISENPHINRLGFPPKDQQIEYLLSAIPPLHHACLYPSNKVLQKEVSIKEYIGCPYVLEMAYGAAQLDFKTFDLHVLETYRNDPRYRYDCSDIGGSISFTTDESGECGIAKSDQIFLKTFGFAYDDDKNRVVCVFLRYLSKLSPEHQQIWKAREVHGSYKLHPDYYKTSILGHWPDYVSLFDAFGMELRLINQMTIAVSGKPMFKLDFGENGENRPKKFAHLLRPTSEEFHAFALLLDKLLSDNLSKDFFQGVISLEEEVVRKDGKIEVRNKGTITLLDEYIRKNIKATDWEPLVDCITALKTIRKIRQRPAHAVDEDKFDLEFIKKQRNLALQGYEVLSFIRNIFERHPAVIRAGIKVPQPLADENIWLI